MSDLSQRIKEKIKCCACGGSLANSKELNIMCLMKEAEWPHPTWGNALLQIPPSFASASFVMIALKKGRRGGRGRKTIIFGLDSKEN